MNVLGDLLLNSAWLLPVSAGLAAVFVSNRDDFAPLEMDMTRASNFGACGTMRSLNEASHRSRAERP